MKAESSNSHSITIQGRTFLYEVGHTFVGVVEDDGTENPLSFAFALPVPMTRAAIRKEIRRRISSANSSRRLT